MELPDDGSGPSVGNVTSEGGNDAPSEDDGEVNPLDEPWYEDWSWNYPVVLAKEEIIGVTSDNVRYPTKDGRGLVYAMVDSGASACVCGERWILPFDELRNKDSWQRSDEKFRLGDGRASGSLGYANLAVYLTSEKGIWRFRRKSVSISSWVEFRRLLLTKPCWSGSA